MNRTYPILERLLFLTDPQIQRWGPSATKIVWICSLAVVIAFALFGYMGWKLHGTLSQNIEHFEASIHGGQDEAALGQAREGLVVTAELAVKMVAILAGLLLLIGAVFVFLILYSGTTSKKLLHLLSERDALRASLSTIEPTRT